MSLLSTKTSENELMWRCESLAQFVFVRGFVTTASSPLHASVLVLLRSWQRLTSLLSCFFMSKLRTVLIYVGACAQMVDPCSSGTADAMTSRSPKRSEGTARSSVNSTNLLASQCGLRASRGGNGLSHSVHVVMCVCARMVKHGSPDVNKERSGLQVVADVSLQCFCNQNQSNGQCWHVHATRYVVINNRWVYFIIMSMSQLSPALFCECLNN